MISKVIIYGLACFMVGFGKPARVFGKQTDFGNYCKTGIYIVVVACISLRRGVEVNEYTHTHIIHIIHIL